MPDIIYVAVAGETPHLSCRPVGADGIDAESCRIDLPGPPADLAVAPDNRFLYADVAIDGEHHYLTFAIDADTGALTPLGEPASVGPYPCHIRTDNTGRWLLAAYYSDGMVTVHAIGADGVAGARVQRLETAHKAHYITTSPDNRFAFVPHVGDENAIWQFRFDEATGQLTANDPPKVSPNPGQGPRHFCFHPQGQLAFSNGEQGSSVTTWRYDEAQGRLTPLSTVSTLPADWEGSNTCSQVSITPDGRHLYSCNRGHDSLAAFAVDAASGELTPRGTFPTVGTPRPLAIAPDGGSLVVAGTQLRVFGIGDDGRLDHVRDLDPGPVAWVLAVRT